MTSWMNCTLRKITAFMYFLSVYDGVRVRSGFIGRDAETKQPSARGGAI